MDIALVQQFLPDAPHEAFQQGLNAVRDAAEAGAELIIFPELSFTPFYPRIPASERTEDVVELAEPVPGPTTESVAEIAEEYGVVVVINLLERDGDRTYDTSAVIDADGTLLGGARMMHVPDYEHFHERGYYTPGDTGAPVYETAAGRLGVATCYDRHYPEYLRALALQDAQVVAIPQAGVAGEWPEGVYESEVQVASFQHGFYAAMANRVGQEADMLFEGKSLVTGPEGRIVAKAPSGTAILLMASIDLDRCADVPARTRFLPDRRPDQYEGGAVRLDAEALRERAEATGTPEEAK
jgi:N-carbamoylputrescine amidase